MKFKNLAAEMARNNIKMGDIARVIEKDEKTARNKTHGVSEFTLPEAVKIRDTFFPSCSLEYLYEVA